MKLKILEASFHRNGICGAGFYAILFEDLQAKDPHNNPMIATLFDEPAHCAVYSVPQLANLNIAFACGNSWRGDVYEGELRPLLKAYLAKEGTNRLGPFSLP